MIGDTIQISFDIDTEEVIDVSTFENINLKSNFGWLFVVIRLDSIIQPLI
jgi:hypothetical protein